MSGDKVVFLAFSNPKTTASDSRDFIACGHCRNKTYTLIEDRAGSFPLLTCAACGAHIGRMGWVPPEDEA